MPVVGHACVGVATALLATPGDSPCRRRSLWLPAFVLLAYLPDVVTQIAAVAGVDAKRACHALPFVVLGGGLAGWAVARWAGMSRRWGVGVGILSVGLHVVLDVLQSTDRQPWWPLSERVVSGEEHLLPTGVWEAVLFGVLACVAWLIDRRRAPRSTGGVRRGAAVWIVALLAAALGTHALRGQRAGDYQRAVACVERGDHAEALAAVQAAGRWPSTGRPGRVAYIRATAHLGLGDRETAEADYLTAMAHEPTFFWAVADLALLYATSGDSAPERAERVEPLLERLDADFPDHPRREHVCAKIRARVADTSP